MNKEINRQRRNMTWKNQVHRNEQLGIIICRSDNPELLRLRNFALFPHLSDTNPRVELSCSFHHSWSVLNIVQVWPQLRIQRQKIIIYQPRIVQCCISLESSIFLGSTFGSPCEP